ncbi:MAG TPA: hypothetical protein PKZ76_00245 [Xanthomonadaceae bacterium]|nr:hypothetical protein [Xanthomonadaceae bacterium]
MKDRRSHERCSGWRRPLGLLGLLAIILPGVDGARAELRLSIPDETVGPPFYMRIEFPSVDPQIVPHNHEWAAIVVYRQESCVPENFNLLDVFDVPGAFSCPLNGLGGFELWQNAPGVDPAPVHSRLTGNGAVPVWFVRHAEFLAAISDGHLTIGELRGLESLRTGQADFYDELLRPSQSNEQPLLHIHARGSFEDGARFRLQWTLSREAGADSNTSRTRIEFLGAGATADEPPLVFPFTGSWFDPDVPGQGLGLHPVRGEDRLFATWYTYDESGQPTWYILDSCAEPGTTECSGVAFDGLRAELAVASSAGGIFGQAGPFELLPAGRMVIEFTGCTTAVADYEVNGRVGSMNLRALVPVDVCRD